MVMEQQGRALHFDPQTAGREKLDFAWTFNTSKLSPKRLDKPFPTKPQIFKVR